VPISPGPSADTDGDGLPDGYEAAYTCLDPGVDDALLDGDGDGLTNLQEYQGGSDPCRGDTDGDGCSDGAEAGADHASGGQRDALNPWDFFDVPAPALRAADTTGARSKTVSLADVLAVLAYTGTRHGGPANANGVSYDTDLNSNGILDGAEYDRSFAAYAGQPWRSGPPDGVVALSDVLIALQQAGDHCN
jgi:Bacterial TSP3 repeat